MNLDLLDRKNKYSNGFCHWPVPAWKKPDGEWCPSQTNFTSLADPCAVGSGLTALTTLMHEAGKLGDQYHLYNEGISYYKSAKK